MSHNKYPKISDNSNKWELPRKVKGLVFVATEKVHGANFAVVVKRSCNKNKEDTNNTDINNNTNIDNTNIDNVDVSFAKRTDMLSPDDDFFNCRSHGLTDNLTPKAISTFNYYINNNCNNEDEKNNIIMTIYGEIFGGMYPETLVKPNPHVGPVQTGVFYSPDIHFIAFDIGITINKQDENDINNKIQNRYFIDFDDAIELLENNGFMCVKPLCRGPLDKCMSCDIYFDSTIPSRLGLPPLEKGSNTAEGVVVKLAKELKVSGDKNRCIMKRKTQHFCEAQYTDDGMKRLHQEALNRRQKGLKLDEKLIQNESLAMVTLQRLQNVISKIGQVEYPSKQHLKSLQQSMCADIDEDLIEVVGDIKLVTHNINELTKLNVKNLIEKHFNMSF
eukprot:GHVR01147570.1.p1 GENE.GHVR01147570.1~~GHVR01147570.1.p1  ORF type:complete len:389 (+),score=101.24 GHVR01147570.1:97-1263(+)